jgi:hypothetical protein
MPAMSGHDGPYRGVRIFVPKTRGDGPLELVARDLPSKINTKQQPLSHALLFCYMRGISLK